MKNEYRIKIEGQITKVNSKEEYEEFKTKYNDYEFMMTNRINEVEAVKKTSKHQKPIKGMPEWFRMWSENVYSKDISNLRANDEKIFGILEKYGQRLDKIEDILERNNLK